MTAMTVSLFDADTPDQAPTMPHSAASSEDALDRSQFAISDTPACDITRMISLSPHNLCSGLRMRGCNGDTFSMNVDCVNKAPLASYFGLVLTVWS
jgi:hypothetical protein